MFVEKMTGEVVTVGNWNLKDDKTGKEVQYPYFEILQRGDHKSEIFAVSGNGFKVGDKAVFSAMVSISKAGKIKIKKVDGHK